MNSKEGHTWAQWSSGHRICAWPWALPEPLSWGFLCLSRQLQNKGMLTALHPGESLKAQGFHLPGLALLVFVVMEPFSLFPCSTRKIHFSASLPWVSQGYKQVQFKWNWDTKSSVSLPIWITLLKNNYCWGCGISQLYQTHPQTLLLCGLLNP